MGNEGNFTILYKCNRCHDISSELSLFCKNCGHRLILKPVLNAMMNREGGNNGKE